MCQGCCGEASPASSSIGGVPMALSAWWQGDPLPALAPLSGFRAGVEHDVDLLAGLTSLPREELRARFDAGHRAYLARLDDTAVAYGWVATLSATVGELV